MQDSSIHKKNNAGVIVLPRLLVLSQLHNVLVNSGRAGFPVKVQLTIVDSGATQGFKHTVCKHPYGCALASPGHT